MGAGDLVYLMYHELELPNRSLCNSDSGYVRYVLAEPSFRSQMLWLKQAGWRGLSVGEALKAPVQPAVAITFDDGAETDLITAAQLLKELAYQATFYVTVGFLGKAGYLSCAQLRELSSLGFEIGCHSMTHCYLTDLDSAGLRREIVDAKQQLQQILGTPVKHFSCPGGRYNQRARNTARAAGYDSVATSRPQANSSSTNPLALGRVPILRHTALPDFQALCQGHGLWKLRFRGLGRETAKSLLGNFLYDRFRAILLGDATSD